MPPSLTPQAFVTKWRNAELSEISAYQQHFLDLCRLIDHPFPADIDPSGKSFAFQAHVDKVSGASGFADALSAPIGSESCSFKRRWRIRCCMRRSSAVSNRH